MSDVERTSFHLFGYPISHSAAPTLMHNVWQALDMPNHRYVLRPTQRNGRDDDLTEFEQLSREPDFGGCAVTMPCKVKVMQYLDKTIGSCNTVFLEHRSGSAPLRVGTNTDWIGVRASLLSAMATDPSPKPGFESIRPDDANTPYFEPGSCSSFIIGGGGTTRAAVFALNSLGCSPIYLINRDSEETKSIVDHFPNLKLIPLESDTQAREVIEREAKAGVRMSVAVGAIPAIAPVTDAEKMVYSISRVLFSRSADEKTAPSKRYLIEMCYKPRRTPMIDIAEQAGWTTICGIEAMIEQGLTQQRLWLPGVDISKGESGAREFVRKMDDIPSKELPKQPPATLAA